MCDRMRWTALGRGRGRRDAAAAAATAPMDCLDRGRVEVKLELLRRIPRGEEALEGGRRWCTLLLVVLVVVMVLV